PSSHSFAAILERHLNNWHDLHVHFFLNNVSANCPNFCAVYERPGIVEGDEATNLVITEVLGLESEHEIGKELTRPATGNLNDSMFVSIIQFMEKPEDAIGTSIPWLVRLQLLDSCLVAGIHPVMNPVLAGVCITDNSRSHTIDSPRVKEDW